MSIAKNVTEHHYYISYNQTYNLVVVVTLGLGLVVVAAVVLVGGEGGVTGVVGVVVVGVVEVVVVGGVGEGVGVV